MYKIPIFMHVAIFPNVQNTQGRNSKEKRLPELQCLTLQSSQGQQLSPGCEILICSWLQTLERNIITAGVCFMSLESSLDC